MRNLLNSLFNLQPSNSNANSNNSQTDEFVRARQNYPKEAEFKAENAQQTNTAQPNNIQNMLGLLSGANSSQLLSGLVQNNSNPLLSLLGGLNKKPVATINKIEPQTTKKVDGYVSVEDYHKNKSV